MMTEGKRGGREVLNRCTRAGRLLYQGRLQEMTERQGGRCGLCGKPFHGGLMPTFDHEHGRGMGGSKQDDRIELLDGTWQNAAVCLDCNLRKGSRRVEYLRFARKTGENQ